MTTITLDIQFPLADRAEAFAKRVSEDGWWTVKVDHKPGRRRVVWTTENRSTDLTDAQFVQDAALTVGYYGSDQSRKAMVTWVEKGITLRAPMSY